MLGTAREIGAVAVVVVVVFDTCMSVENGVHEPEPKYLRRWGVRVCAVSSRVGMGMGILRLVSRHCRRLMHGALCLGRLSVAQARVASNHGYCRPVPIYSPIAALANTVLLGQ